MLLNEWNSSVFRRLEIANISNAIKPFAQMLANSKSPSSHLSQKTFFFNH